MLMHSNGGGWVARHLTTLLCSHDFNVQIAALTALASLVKDNHDVTVHLARALAGRSSTDACVQERAFSTFSFSILHSQLSHMLVITGLRLHFQT